MKHKLLVDKLTETENFGFTNNVKKIDFNLNLIGKEFSDRIDLHNLFTENGITCVFSIGKYVTVLERSKDKSKGTMSFFDFDNIGEVSGFRKNLEKQFTENIISEWFKEYYLLSKDFTEEDDVVSLLSEPN